MAARLRQQLRRGWRQYRLSGDEAEAKRDCDRQTRGRAAFELPADVVEVGRDCAVAHLHGAAAGTRLSVRRANAAGFWTDLPGRRAKTRLAISSLYASLIRVR